VEIRQRSVEPVVELFVSGENAGFLRVRPFERSSYVVNDLFVRRVNLDPGIVAQFAGNSPTKARLLACLDMDLKRCERLA
jgi:hypothetical protein